MRAQDQAQLPQPPPPTPPQPVEQLQQQLTQVTCPICFNHIGSHESRRNCNVCHAQYHSGEITTWLITRLNKGHSLTCPTCRTNMAWVLNDPLPALVPHNPGDNNNGGNTPPGIQPVELELIINNWNWEMVFE